MSWPPRARFTEAAVAIFVGMVMDMLDGKVARLTKTTTQFGVEFDSLADVVSFCVAPAFMLYSFALARLGRVAWLGAFLFVICGALRLARFNVYSGVSGPALLRGAAHSRRRGHRRRRHAAPRQRRARALAGGRHRRGDVSRGAS